MSKPVVGVAAGDPLAAGAATVDVAVGAAATDPRAVRHLHADLHVDLADGPVTVDVNDQVRGPVVHLPERGPLRGHRRADRRHTDELPPWLAIDDVAWPASSPARRL